MSVQMEPEYARRLLVTQFLSSDETEVLRVTLSSRPCLCGVECLLL